MDSDSYKVAELNKFGEPLVIATRQFKPLQAGEVLVKVACVTIHPADGGFLKGRYGDKIPNNFPLVPGSEGSGEIVEVGSSVGKELVGKRCSFMVSPSTSDGAWSQYIISEASKLLIFNDTIDFEKIAFAIGNPLTAAGFIDTIESKQEKVVAQNAGFSAVGKIFIRFCKEKGIKSISLVRKPEQVQPLKDIGGDYVFNTSDPKWKADFEQVGKELNVQSFFECVGGEMTGTILSLLPAGATLYHYGNLELKPLTNISTADFIFHRKKLEGWWLVYWTKEAGFTKLGNWFAHITKEILSGSDVFDTAVSNKFRLEEINEAIAFYFSNMSAGKVIITPNN